MSSSVQKPNVNIYLCKYLLTWLQHQLVPGAGKYLDRLMEAIKTQVLGIFNDFQPAEQLVSMT